MDNSIDDDIYSTDGGTCLQSGKYICNVQRQVTAGVWTAVQAVKHACKVLGLVTITLNESKFMQMVYAD